jgi:hypothetical protein
MVVKEAAWSGMLGLEFEISLWKRREGRQRVVCVGVSGKYWTGKSEGGVVIAMIVGAAMASPYGACHGLVLDLRALEYTGGDMLFYWRDVLNQFKLPEEYGFALVCSDGNRRHVQSLIEDQGQDDLGIHASVEEAVGHTLGFEQ